MAFMLSVLLHNGTMDTKSKPTFVLLGHPFLLVYPFMCFLSLFAHLCASFVSLLSLLHVYRLCVFFVIACTRFE